VSYRSDVFNLVAARVVFVAIPPVISGACGAEQGANAGDAGADRMVTKDADTPEVRPPPFDGPTAPTFCDLPGSLIFGTHGTTLIAEGNAAAPSLTWLTLPPGFCVHYFAHVNLTRQIRFAPGGELFVASPSTPTAGGAGSTPGTAGLGAIAVLVDENHDGYADGDAFPHGDGSPQKLALFNPALPNDVTGDIFWAAVGGRRVTHRSAT
jgi:hypothetical protein